MTRRRTTFLTALTLALVALSRPPVSAQTFPVTPILVNGDMADKINIVFLGDGYTSAQMALYLSDVQNATNALFFTPPYANYKSFFNVYAIEVPSVESGTDHPYTAADCPGGLATFYSNTFFNTTFDYQGIHRLLVVQNSLDVYAVLAANFPAWDVVFMVVNHSYYGGSGGAFAVFSTVSSAAEIAIHELGHSFSDLADEYEYGGLPGYEAPNTTAETTRELIKWTDWIEASTPVPTPETVQYAGVIGLFEGAVYNALGWYRPRLDCKMRTLGIPFCSVCSERTVQGVYTLVPVILSHDPLDPTVALYIGQTREFSITTSQPVPSTIETTWYVDGSPVETGSDTHMFVAGDYGHGTYSLQAVSRDVTALVRTDPSSLLESSYTWTVSVDTVVTSVSHRALSRQARLYQNFPNPFNPQTTIEYTVSDRAPIAIEIFDASGALVRRLDQGLREAGSYRAEWDGRDAAEQSVSSGVYFYRLVGVKEAEVRKMVLVK